MARGQIKKWNKWKKTGHFSLQTLFLPLGAPLGTATHPDSGLDQLVGEGDSLVEAGVDVGGDEVRGRQRVGQVVRGQQRRQQRVSHAEQALAALDLCGVIDSALVKSSRLETFEIDLFSNMIGN